MGGSQGAIPFGYGSWGGDVHGGGTRGEMNSLERLMAENAALRERLQHLEASAHAHVGGVD